MEEFVSLDECALYNNVSKASLQKKRYQDKLINRTDRFVGDKVALNYERPLEFEISDLYYKALIVAGSEFKLSKDLARVLKTKVHNVYSYLHRFNFKHYKQANAICNALKEYCDNSIFSYVDENGVRQFAAEF